MWLKRIYIYIMTAAALAEAEKQINAQNAKYNAGESTFFEELNPLSDLPKDVLEAQKVYPTFCHFNSTGGLKLGDIS